MTHIELGAALAALFGTHKGALADAGRAFSVDRTNLAAMVRGARPVPEGLASEVLLALALHTVLPPPASLRPEDDRDEPCAEALHPHLDALCRRAVTAGWAAPEIVCTTLTWAIQRTIEMAGLEAARDLVDSAAEMVAISPAAPASGPT